MVSPCDFPTEGEEQQLRSHPHLRGAEPHDGFMIGDAGAREIIELVRHQDARSFDRRQRVQNDSTKRVPATYNFLYNDS